MARTSTEPQPGHFAPSDQRSCTMKLNTAAPGQPKAVGIMARASLCHYGMIIFCKSSEQAGMGAADC
jgi:hypothetical protein